MKVIFTCFSFTQILIFVIYLWPKHLCFVHTMKTYRKAYMQLLDIHERQRKEHSILKRKCKGLEEELEGVYQDMEKYEQGLGGNKRKKGKGYDMFDHANEEPVGTVVTEVFREYTFLARKRWMGYTPKKTGSTCGRLKAVIDLGGRQFSERLWRGRLCPMLNNKLVDLRSRYNTCMSNAYKGNCPMQLCLKMQQF